MPGLVRDPDPPFDVFLAATPPRSRRHHRVRFFATGTETAAVHFALLSPAP